MLEIPKSKEADASRHCWQTFIALTSVWLSSTSTPEIKLLTVCSQRISRRRQINFFRGHWRGRRALWAIVLLHRPEGRRCCCCCKAKKIDMVLEKKQRRRTRNLKYSWHRSEFLEFDAANDANGSQVHAGHLINFFRTNIFASRTDHFRLIYPTFFHNHFCYLDLELQSTNDNHASSPASANSVKVSQFNNRSWGLLPPSLRKLQSSCSLRTCPLTQRSLSL